MSDKSELIGPRPRQPNPESRLFLRDRQPEVSITPVTFETIVTEITAMEDVMGEIETETETETEIETDMMTTEVTETGMVVLGTDLHMLEKAVEGVYL